MDAAAGGDRPDTRFLAIRHAGQEATDFSLADAQVRRFVELRDAGAGEEAIAAELGLEPEVVRQLVSADEAQALGLLNRVVPDESLMSEAHALAQTMVGKSPLVLKLLKRAVIDGAEMPLSAALRHEQAMISLVFDSADAHEGMSAFLEKRQPKFRGV
jgi:1,4-dihydroxy-2-naphthoyl-CoA synthase